MSEGAVCAGRVAGMSLSSEFAQFGRMKCSKRDTQPSIAHGGIQLDYR